MATSRIMGLSLATAGAMALTVLSLGSASAGTMHPYAATWLFNEPPGATVAVDSSGYGHNGPIEPGAQVTGAGYYRFNGAGRVVVPNDPKGGLDPYTGECLPQRGAAHDLGRWHEHRAKGSVRQP